MVSLRTIVSAVAVLATAASAMPAASRLSARQLEYYKIAKRQNEMAKSQNLTDADIGQLYVLPTSRLPEPRTDAFRPQRPDVRASGVQVLRPGPPGVWQQDGREDEGHLGKCP